MASPTIAGWELSRRLRARRHELGLDSQTVATALGFSRNYLSAVENDRARLADDRFDAIVELFELDRGDREEVLALRQLAREVGWWDEYATVLVDDVRRLYGLEAGATRIRAYESSIVNGLLQTPGYARELMESHPDVRPADTARLLEVRRRRQERLDGPGAPELVTVTSETALLQNLGSPSVLKEQLVHLVEVIDSRPNVEVRVHPFTAPPGGAATSSTLYLLDFDRPFLPPTVAWQESMFALGIEEDPDRIELMNLCFDQVLRSALSPAESREMIAYYATVPS